MTIDLIMLLTITLMSLVGTPLYMYFREKMMKPGKGNVYTKKRVIKVTLFNIFPTLIVGTQLLLILIGILLRDRVFDTQTVFLAAVCMLLLFLLFYGAGIYVTSIVTEAYSTPDLRKQKSFAKQFVAVKLFTGR